jgi:hypothetical protein
VSAGRHRDPDDVVTDLIATVTGPLRRPSRQQLGDRTDRWDGPERRHLTRTDERPAAGWDQAAAPDVDVTGPIPWVHVLNGPDPVPTGPLQLWEHSGPLPILPPPRETDPPSMRWAWALGVYLLLAVAAALFTISLAGG